MSELMMHNAPHTLVRAGSRRRLSLALAATAAWFVVELAAGFYTNSLALIADAAHMLTDVAALSPSDLPVPDWILSESK